MSKYSKEARERRNAQSAKWWADNGAAYKEANKEKFKEYCTRYREANRDLVRERVAAFQKEYPERQREFEIKYRARHPDRRKASCAKYRGKPGVLEKERENWAAWAKENRDKLAAKAAARRALKLKATPLWVNLVEIEAFYVEARRLTIETGIEHHVDHIVPLKSKVVCGLHCPANLQVLPGPENLSKNNRRWPDMW